MEAAVGDSMRTALEALVEADVGGNSVYRLLLSCGVGRSLDTDEVSDETLSIPVRHAIPLYTRD